MSMEGVLRLYFGESNLPTPDYIKQAAIRAMHDGFTFYTENAGLPSLRRAIAENYQRLHGVDLDPTAEIVVTASGVQALNVGSGVRTSVLDVAHAVRRHFGADVPVQVNGAFRVGDIRHNAADIARLAALTGFAPQWTFAAGLVKFLAWAQTHEAIDAGFERSLQELKERGLMGAPAA